MKYFILLGLLVLLLSACTPTQPVQPQELPEVPSELVGSAEESGQVTLVIEEEPVDGIPEWILIDRAYRDELKAYRTYKQVIADHGAVLPFSNIVNAETTHMQYLEVIYDDRGYTLPDYYGEIPSFATVQEACQAGVEAELENVALYDALLSNPLPEDTRELFLQLQSASQEKHLPAFERCS